MRRTLELGLGSDFGDFSLEDMALSRKSGLDRPSSWDPPSATRIADNVKLRADAGRSRSREIDTLTNLAVFDAANISLAR